VRTSLLRKVILLYAISVVITRPQPATAFFEDLCVSKTNQIVGCLGIKTIVERLPGRSMVHADATYFLAQALGYRSDVAYWIAAYNEVADLTRYAPIDQCGGQASSKNSGRRYITATFNGFARTNTKTDGPLYHYVLPFSPNGNGTDVHGASGVQAVYPLHYPAPGYPDAIDDIYQGTLYNLRQWAMEPGRNPGFLCAAGLTEPRGLSHFSGSSCLAGVPIHGTVPLLKMFNFGTKIEARSGPKILDDSHGVMTYESLDAWLADQNRTSGTLWKDPAAPSVPVQVARIGIYLHTLQDTASHATYCGDDAPSPPGGGDVGTYMALAAEGVRLLFGASCAAGPHIAGHLEETGTGDKPLPLRDYTALNATLKELVVFGNVVAKPQGWIVNPELLPASLSSKNQQGESVTDLENLLVGTIVDGRAWTRGEVYRSGVVTLPLQQIKPSDRLHAMNAAFASYSDTARGHSANAARFTALELMPGNARDPGDSSVCFK
jgi:hypothetical protein